MADAEVVPMSDGQMIPVQQLTLMDVQRLHFEEFFTGVDSVLNDFKDLKKDIPRWVKYGFPANARKRSVLKVSDEAPTQEQKDECGEGEYWEPNPTYMDYVMFMVGKFYPMLVPKLSGMKIEYGAPPSSGHSDAEIQAMTIEKARELVALDEQAQANRAQQAKFVKQYEEEQAS